MKAIFYNNNSPNNKLVKDIVNSHEVEIVLKDSTSFLTPVIKIKNVNVLEYNYCYIPSFKRYYFVSDLEIFPKEIQIAHLEIDVLMSYKDMILQNVIQLKESQDYNPYIADLKAKPQITLETKEFDDMFRLSDNFILITAKGSVFSEGV